MHSLKRFTAIALTALCLATSKTFAADPAALDQRTIHGAYNEGDFDKVVKGIQAFIAANPTCSREDSLFIARHLAVVYTANSKTQERGKHFMVRLLEIMPTADLSDMFVSDEIAAVFAKVRADFFAGRPAMPAAPAAETRSAAQARTASAQAVSAPAHSEEFDAAPPEKPLWKKPVFWIAGGASALIAGGLVAYAHLQEEGSGKTFVVPPSTTQH